MCSQCPGRTSRVENKEWDSCTVASFERTHSAVCSLKNSLYRDKTFWEHCNHLKISSLSFALFYILVLSLSLVLSILVSLLEQRVRSLGRNGDIFKGPSAAERTAFAKPTGSKWWISGHRAQRGYRNLSGGYKSVCAFMHMFLCLL